MFNGLNLPVLDVILETDGAPTASAAASAGTAAVAYHALPALRAHPAPVPNTDGFFVSRERERLRQNPSTSLPPNGTTYGGGYTDGTAAAAAAAITLPALEQNITAPSPQRDDPYKNCYTCSQSYFRPLSSKEGGLCKMEKAFSDITHYGSAAGRFNGYYTVIDILNNQGYDGTSLWSIEKRYDLIFKPINEFSAIRKIDPQNTIPEMAKVYSRSLLKPEIRQQPDHHPLSQDVMQHITEQYMAGFRMEFEDAIRHHKKTKPGDILEANKNRILEQLDAQYSGTSPQPQTRTI